MLGDFGVSKCLEESGDMAKSQHVPITACACACACVDGMGSEWTVWGVEADGTGIRADGIGGWSRRYDNVHVSLTGGNTILSSTGSLGRAAVYVHERHLGPRMAKSRNCRPLGATISAR
eukprot:1478424-Pyramimonas_sp.AAC.1